MKKLIGKTITIFLLMAIVVSNLPLGTIAAAVRPSVSVSEPNTRTVTEGDTVKYTVTFSNADDINLSADYINLNGFTANKNVSGSGNTRIITLSNVQGTAGKKSISIKSGAATNDAGSSLATPNTVTFTLNERVVSTPSVPSTPSTPTVPSTPSTPSVPATPAVDTVRPSVSLSNPSLNAVNVGGTVSYVVSFADNQAVTRVNLSAAYVNLNGFTADITITGNGDSRTVTLSNIQGAAGRKNISIKAGAAEDAAGNATIATPNSVSFTLNATATPVPSVTDNVRPSISISEPSAREIYTGGTVSYVITFADNRGIARVNLSEAYLTFNGFTADVTITGSGNTRTVTLSNVQGDVGVNYNIVVKAGAAEDAAGNGTIQTPHSVSFKLVQKGTNQTPTTSGTTSKLDGEPNTGVESLPVLPIMGGAATVLTTIGYVVTKKIYG